ncbi:MAG: major facilitator superfamily 1 [Hyphomicrobiales bacterium]|nr:major facilitator superfamily 1 [Hyphomicrobiales bacterium]
MSGARGWAVFRFHDYRAYVLCRFLWQIGLQMQNVAVAWLVYDVTRDPLALGLIGLCAFIPSVPLSLVTGPVADRYDRRWIIIISCILMSISSITLLLLLLNGWLAPGRMAPVYATIVLLGSARAFANPAGQALMSVLVPDDEFPSAVAWNNSTNQIANVGGPAVGSLLLTLGNMVPFVVSTVCFLAAVVLAYAIKARPPRAEKIRATWSVIVSGYRFIWSRPVIFGAITLDLVAVLLGGATALLPVFTRDIFMTEAWGLGVLRSTSSVGSIIAALALANYPLRWHAGRTMFVCVMIYGACTVGFGLSTNIVVAGLFLLVLGAADMVSVVIRQSLIQIETPNEMRGRVMAVHTILTGTSNQLGEFESGLLASFIGAVPTVLFGGVSAFTAALVWMRLFPSLRNREKI